RRHPGTSRAAQPRLTLPCSLTSLSAASPGAASPSSCLQTKLQRQQKTFFFICTAETEWLDGKHVVSGKVKEGMNIVEAMERFGSRNDKTSKKITVADCGQS
ncbi:hypothetical protein E2I00_003024, partial [Balaenoptera physalus]